MVLPLDGTIRSYTLPLSAWQVRRYRFEGIPLSGGFPRAGSAAFVYECL